MFNFKKALSILLVFILLLTNVSISATAGADNPDKPWVDKVCTNHIYEPACADYCRICHYHRGYKHEYENSCANYCMHCNSEYRETSHKYSSNCDEECNVCGAWRSNTVQHTYTNNCDTTCNACGATRYTWHSYDHECDTACNVCGAIREVPHWYDSDCDVECNNYQCKNKRSAPAAHKFDNVCDQTCNYCSYWRETEHEYTNDCDEDCNKCGATRGIDHTYSNECDRGCNVCGHARETKHWIGTDPAYLSDASGHWYQCYWCNARVEFETHDYLDGTCTICGHVGYLSHGQIYKSAPFIPIVNYDGTVDLPEVSNAPNAIFIGWTNADGTPFDKNYVTDNTMISTNFVGVGDMLKCAIEKGTNDTTLPTDATYTNGLYIEGVQVRVPLNSTDPALGLRFVSVVNDDLIDFLNSTDGIFDVKFGTIVAKESDITGEMKIDTEKIVVAYADKIWRSAETLGASYQKFTACITGIPQSDLQTKLVIRPFISYTDVMGNEIVVYGEQYSGADLYSAAQAAYNSEGETNEVKEYLQNNIISKVEPDVEHGGSTGDGTVEETSSSTVDTAGNVTVDSTGNVTVSGGVVKTDNLFN